ncbi:hypothetical protein [Methylomonas sp. LWB]|uniref:hypothetical protein n=1 Tax=Methylomonas sp. LWB TaxID=1905845 RepID=UPI0011154783|nr:hypothetical protein [Methylomonas sp. LWB]
MRKNGYLAFALAVLPITVFAYPHPGESEVLSGVTLAWPAETPCLGDVQSCQSSVWWGEHYRHIASVRAASVKPCSGRRLPEPK